MDVKGKVVIVTGASAGIGRAVAQRFAVQGASVVVAARTEQALKRLADELNQAGLTALAVPTDVRDAAAVKRLVETAVQRFGRVDVLINNAGQSIVGKVAELDLDLFHQALELNVFGALYAIQAVVPEMRRTGGGIIVTVSSTTADYVFPGFAAYSASKAALNMLSRTAREELKGEHIRVLTVLPNATDTGLNENAVGDQTINQGLISALKRMRRATPEHVADKILEAVQKETAEVTIN